MTTFNDREKAAENKYAHDQEQEFRVYARRCKLIGQWAAARMNLTGPHMEEYVNSLITATISTHDDETLVARIKSDLSARGVSISDHDLREELFRLTQVAKDQINGE